MNVYACARCGCVVFPRRLLCPGCGGVEWSEVDAGKGTVEEVTALRRAPGRTHDPPVLVASVRLDAGPVVVARVEEKVEPGARVRLRDDRGVPTIPGGAAGGS